MAMFWYVREKTINKSTRSFPLHSSPVCGLRKRSSASHEGRGMSLKENNSWDKVCVSHTRAMLTGRIQLDFTWKMKSTVQLLNILLLKRDHFQPRALFTTWQSEWKISHVDICIYHLWALGMGNPMHRDWTVAAAKHPLQSKPVSFQTHSMP